MTFQNEADAKRAATFIRSHMINPSVWKIEVWQNMGWHCALKCNNVNLGIHTDTKGSRLGYRDLQDGFTFCVLVNSNKDQCGSGLASWSDTSHDYQFPQEAVDAAVKAARLYTIKLAGAVDAATRATSDHSESAK